MRRFLVALSSILALAVLGGPAAAASQAVFRGVLTPTHFDVSPPLRELARNATPLPAKSQGPENRASGLEGPDGPQDADGAVQGAAGALAMPATIVNVDALSNLCSCTPPSPSLAVGRNHVVLVDHLHYAVYDKTGALLLGPLTMASLWAGFGVECPTQAVGLPTALYDREADRWVLVQVGGTGAGYHVCFAVSTTGDPTGAWFRYSFSTGTNFPDYTLMSRWWDAYYVSTREFSGAGPFDGVGAYAVNRAQLLAGNPATQVLSFLVPPGATPSNIGDGLAPADLDGATAPPAGSSCYFLGSMDQGGPYGAPQDALTLWRFHADFTTPALSSFTLAQTLPVTGFDSMFPFGVTMRDQIPQPGTAVRLDHLGYRQRVLPRLAYRNFGTHESLVATQSVEALANLSGIRWYELRNPGGVATVHQQGTYAPGMVDGTHRWAGNAAMDHDGNLAIGYSISDAVATFPGIRYSGRLAGDPLGTLPQGEGTIVNGGGAQTSTARRWGDHSAMAVDPGDDCTFWYATEYYPATSAQAWRLRIASFKYPTCSAVGVETEAASADRFELAVTSPARDRVVIRFALAGSAWRRVRVEVFDVVGRRVASVVDESLAGGRYRVAWDGATAAGGRPAGGVYKVRLRAGDETATRTLVLLN